MKGDFSRFTFDPANHFNSVRMQQGRVQLDSDWNEQADILAYLQQTHLKDILGPYGAPQASAGFKISIHHSRPSPASEQEQPDAPRHAHKQRTQPEHDAPPVLDFHIGRGRYYVDGLLCENEQDVLYLEQPDYPQVQLPAGLEEHGLVYLDVWQHNITAFENQSLRDIALGGIDTTTRVKTVWQAKILPISSDHLKAEPGTLTLEEIASLPEWQDLEHRQSRKAHMMARRVPHSTALDNLLYRVEVHAVAGKEVMFKWSRENGSVAFDVERVLSYEKQEKQAAQCVIIVADLGRDMLQLQKDDWVEIVDEAAVLSGRTHPLYRIATIPDTAQRRVTLLGPYSSVVEALSQDASTRLLLRRWDHSPSDAAAQRSGILMPKEQAWLDLERGIQVSFTHGGSYEVGDYWLIPTRTLSDTIEWPSGEHGPQARPPHGINHHYCPLALLTLHGQRDWHVAKDLRRIFATLPVLTGQLARPQVIEETIIEEVRDDPSVPRRMIYEVCASDEQLEPGDLVSLVPGSHLRVTRTIRDNAPLVFGVVSAAQTDNGERQYRVTIYGRARCKVIERIEAGDLLTASEHAGCATRTGMLHELFKPGSLIGKALVSHTHEDDDTPALIDVMVTLQ
jgi:hypothetical protein